LVGAAIAAVGLGVLVATFSLSSGAALTQSDSASVSPIVAHSSTTLLLTGVSQASATVEVVWASPHYLEVEIFAPGSCPTGHGVCPKGPPLATWWNDSGSWTYTGSVAFPLILNLTNPNATTGSFSATLLETYHPGAWTNPTWVQFLTLAGAILLLAIGGLTVFLAIFLRSGVYQREVDDGPSIDGDDDFDLDDPGDLDADLDGDEPPDAGVP
jgi:hypothetical protein